MKATILVILGALLPYSLLADERIAQAIQQLQRQISLCTNIQPFVERQDLSRLFVIRAASKRVIDSIQDRDRGPLNSATNNEYNNLLYTYVYSKSYFEEITSDRTASELEELGTITADIRRAHGFDTSATMNTHDTFAQMHKLVVQLLSHDLQEEFRKKLEDLKVPIGNLMGAGADSFPVYEQAIPVCIQVRKLYPYFYQIASSNTSFDLTLEIQGLNELYIDRVKLEEALRRQREGKDKP